MSNQAVSPRRWDWKRTAVIALVGGTGIGFGGVIGLYSVDKYENRQKSWDTSSITVYRAKAEGVSVADGFGPAAKTTGTGVMFTLDLENNTPDDLTLFKNETKVLQQQRGTGALRGTNLSLSDDVKLPAHHKIELTIAKFDLCGAGVSEQACFADYFASCDHIVLMDDLKKLEIRANSLD